MSTAAQPPQHRDRSADSANHDHRRDVAKFDPSDTRDAIRRQKERFGGMKVGACFFGWLTVTGTAALLTDLVPAAGAAFGLGHEVSTSQAASNPQTIGLVGGIVLLVVVLIAYVAGGYVAGRMARFDGVKQGIGVWLWAIIIAIVATILSLIGGSQFNLFTNLNGFPRIPINEGTLTIGDIMAAIVLVAAALLGAMLGGLAGMRFHRRVDDADLSTAR